MYYMYIATVYQQYENIYDLIQVIVIDQVQFNRQPNRTHNPTKSFL